MLEAVAEELQSHLVTMPRSSMLPSPFFMALLLSLMMLFIMVMTSSTLAAEANTRPHRRIFGFFNSSEKVKKWIRRGYLRFPRSVEPFDEDPEVYRRTHKAGCERPLSKHPEAEEIPGSSESFFSEIWNFIKSVVIQFGQLIAMFVPPEASKVE